MPPAQRRPRLAGPASIAALAGATLAGLAALFLRAGDTRRGLARSSPDSLAVAYLQALVARHPLDAGTRGRLARAQLEVGLYRDAERTLAPLLEDGRPPPAEADLLAVDAALAAWRAAPAGSADRTAAEARAVGRLEVVLERDGEAAGLGRLAGVARELGRPDLAARAHQKAAQLDGPACARWLSEAARDFLAAGDPRSAADAQARGYDCSADRGEALAAGLRALDAYLAAGIGGEALRLADRLVERFPEEAAVLQRAEAIALGQDDRERARRFGERLMAIGSVDAVSLGRQLDLDLAAGDLAGALGVAERLAAQSPEDARLQLGAAKVATWAGRPDLALRHWMWLARHAPTRDGVDQALGAARAARDVAAVAELLGLRARKEPLPAASLAELAEALESAGPPGSAVAALEAYARRHPGSREAWEALASAQERRRDLAAARATLTGIAGRFGGSLQGSVRLARLLWALDRPGAALSELRRWTASAGPDEVVYWELLAALAWDREADEVARGAYRALWEAGRIDAAGAERLLLLSRDAGRPEDVIRYGREGWARTHQPRLLLLAMDEAARAGRWGDLGQLTAQAAGAPEAFASLPAYWTLRARMEERAGRVPEAVEAYRRALAADPGSATARSGLIWLLAGARDREALSRCLAAWGADAWNDPALWRAYAAGLEELGRRREALAFYEREARADPGDAEVERLAGAMSRAGDRVAAARVLTHLAERQARSPVRAPIGSGDGTPAAALAPGPVAGPDAPGFAGARRFAAVGASARAEVIGPVTMRQLRTTARSEALGAQVEVRVGLTGFGSGEPGLRLPGEETEVLARAAFAALGGRNEAAGGVSLRADGNLPRVELVHSRDLAPFAQARLEASLDEPADESAAMRVEAARTRLGGALSLAGGDLYGRGGLDWRRWSTRAGAALGSGAAATAEVGWRPRPAEADVRIRLQGGYQRNWTASGPATEALAAFAPGASSILPRQVAALGLGAGAGRWRVGPARLLADGWVGWIGPPARAAFRAEIGVSIEPLRGGELSLTGFASNDRWTRGGSYGVGVAFTQGFSR